MRTAEPVGFAVSLSSAAKRVNVLVLVNLDSPLELPAKQMSSAKGRDVQRWRARCAALSLPVKAARMKTARRATPTPRTWDRVICSVLRPAGTTATAMTSVALVLAATIVSKGSAALSATHLRSVQERLRASTGTAFRSGAKRALALMPWHFALRCVRFLTSSSFFRWAVTSLTSRLRTVRVRMHRASTLPVSMFLFSMFLFSMVGASTLHRQTFPTWTPASAAR